MRRTELKRTGGPRRRTRIKSKSGKRIEMHYGDFVAIRLARSRQCEVGPRIALVDPLWFRLHCTGRATGLHHLRKRSAGGRLKTRLGSLRSCSSCNQWVEDHPTHAHLVGLVVRPGDPWWPWLGQRLPSGRKL